jgi:hypothetical protein
MARPKGSKNKPKAQPPAKAKAKPKPPAKAEPPDWLRKAMAPTKTPQKRGPRPTRVKEKAQTLAKAKRGKKPMATKPFYDPLDDPDLKAGTKDEALITPAPPKPDQSLPGNPIKPGKPAPLPGGGVAPEGKAGEPAPEQQFDEVQSGADIPDENIQMLIAGTLGGSGDNHASAKRIVERMHQANWTITKALDEGIGDTRSKAGKGKTDTSIKPDDRKAKEDDEDAKRAKY